jgi:hypothetical protein
VLGGDPRGGQEEGAELPRTKGDLHGGPREDVGGADEDGVPNLEGELLGLEEGRELPPGRLGDPEGVQEAGKLGAVLTPVDHRGGGSKDVAAGEGKREGEVLSLLASH